MAGGYSHWGEAAHVGLREGVGPAGETVSRALAKHECTRITEHEAGPAVRGLTCPQALLSIFAD